jgi:hypothetical protein
MVQEQEQEPQEQEPQEQAMCVKCEKNRVMVHP